MSAKLCLHSITQWLTAGNINTFVIDNLPAVLNVEYRFSRITDEQIDRAQFRFKPCRFRRRSSASAMSKRSSIVGGHIANATPPLSTRRQFIGPRCRPKVMRGLVRGSSIPEAAPTHVLQHRHRGANRSSPTSVDGDTTPYQSPSRYIHITPLVRTKALILFFK